MFALGFIFFAYQQVIRDPSSSTQEVLSVMQPLTRNGSKATHFFHLSAPLLLSQLSKLAPVHSDIVKCARMICQSTTGS